jgi:hypothetical protein
MAQKPGGTNMAEGMLAGILGDQDEKAGLQIRAISVRLFASFAVLLFSIAAEAQPSFADPRGDPPPDTAHPARLEAVHIPSHGLKF